MLSQGFQFYRWTRQDFAKMAAKGIFHPEERLELIRGNIIQMSPQTSFHATTIRLIEEALRSVCLQDCDVRVQLPIALMADSEPEPDIAVVSGKPRDYRDRHPETALLIVEVSDSTLILDRKHKKKLYAGCKIPEYWILNLKDRCLEVYRKPVKESYRIQEVFHAEDTVSPLFNPEASVAVADLLP